MKKIILIILVIGFLPAFSVRAESENQSFPTRQNILRERIEKQKINYKQNLQEAHSLGEQYKATKNPEERKEIREKARASFALRLSNVIERLTLFQDQAEERINLAESQDVQVEASREKLAESREYLEVTKQKQNELQVLLENEETLDKEKVKQLLQEIKQNLHNTRISLMESMKLLKKALIEDTQAEDDTTDEEENDDNEEGAN
jgi:hypothetical protein